MLRHCVFSSCPFSLFSICFLPPSLFPCCDILVMFILLFPCILSAVYLVLALHGMPAFTISSPWPSMPSLLFHMPPTTSFPVPLFYYCTFSLPCHYTYPTAQTPKCHLPSVPNVPHPCQYLCHLIVPLYPVGLLVLFYSHCLHQILESVCFTHSCDIVHRDLKVSIPEGGGGDMAWGPRWELAHCGHCTLHIPIPSGSGDTVHGEQGRVVQSNDGNVHPGGHEGVQLKTA